MYVHRCVHMYKYMYTYMHVCMHTCMYIHTYMYMWASRGPGGPGPCGPNWALVGLPGPLKARALCIYTYIHVYIYTYVFVYASLDAYVVMYV